MTVLGINLDATRLGRRLRDGGACLVSEGRPVIGIAEERLSRVKHDAGFGQSLDYCLKGAGLHATEIDMCIATSCCEPIRNTESLLPLEGFDCPIDTVSHHDAHAYSAFWPSPFDDALIIVLDAGGNTLGGDTNGRWWTAAREQASYYVGSSYGIELIERDFDQPFDVGFGEMFRAFTHYLGWPSSTFAGNTMALAGLGRGDLLNKPIWSLDAGRLRSPVSMDPRRPIEMVSKLLRQICFEFPEPRAGGQGFRQEHADLAELLQWSFYGALRSRVESLVRRTGIRRACFAGGVAFNCVAIGQLLADGILDEVFVQPAAGDTGQCLGAAYVAYERVGGRRPTERPPFSCYLGRQYELDEVMRSMAAIDDARIRCSFTEDRVDAILQTARKLAGGHTVAWFSGASEFGPRALGSRSLLGDPRDLDVRKRLLEIKGREAFMPFAPSVLNSAQHQYFAGPGSEYMTVAVRATERAHREIPAAIHSDGTARVQIISDQDGAFARMVRWFGEVTGVELVLNTSLNLRGQPMAESPADAVALFMNSEIDCLYMDGILVAKD